MSRISIELVPRSEEVLAGEIETVRNEFPLIDTINIPDIIRLPIRSWQACQIASKQIRHTIPHIRSIDFDLTQPEKIISIIQAHSFKEVLVVTGDPPQDLSHKIYRTSSIALIAFLKKNFPTLKVYGALDPYRSGLKEEMDYLIKKRESGADGFFTQPFFDIKFMEIYSEQLKGLNVYWGVSPVLGVNSRIYWENRNNAFFPSHFSPTIEWNREFAKSALSFVKERGDNIYFMPIKTSLTAYLGGILNSEIQ